MTATRIRRIRSVTPEGTPKILTRQMADTLKSISILQRQIDMMTAEVATRSDQLMKAMTKAGLTHFDVEGADADIARSAGKATNTIDPALLFKKVDRDDFFSAISVSVTKAKALLGQKELDSITTTTPGKPGEPKLKITLK